MIEPSAAAMESPRIRQRNHLPPLPPPPEEQREQCKRRLSKAQRIDVPTRVRTGIPSRRPIEGPRRHYSRSRCHGPAPLFLITLGPHQVLPLLHVVFETTSSAVRTVLRQIATRADRPKQPQQARGRAPRRSPRGLPRSARTGRRRRNKSCKPIARSPTGGIPDYGPSRGSSRAPAHLACWLRISGGRNRR